MRPFLKCMPTFGQHMSVFNHIPRVNTGKTLHTPNSRLLKTFGSFCVSVCDGMLVCCQTTQMQHSWAHQLSCFLETCSVLIMLVHCVYSCHNYKTHCNVCVFKQCFTPCPTFSSCTNIYVTLTFTVTDPWVGIVCLLVFPYCRCMTCGPYLSGEFSWLPTPSDLHRLYCHNTTVDTAPATTVKLHHRIACLS